MRSTVYFLPARTSVTDSVGISTRPILSSRPKAFTRDSSDSFTLRSNPEYEWMMYHFILGLRGFSATAVASCAAGCAPSASLLVLFSSCIVISKFPALQMSALRQILNQLCHRASERVVNSPEIKRKQKYGNDHHGRGGLNFLHRRSGDFAHFIAQVVIEGLDPLRPGLDRTAKAVVGCGCVRHFLCSYCHHITWPSAQWSVVGGQ